MPIALLLQPLAGALRRGIQGAPGALGLSAWVELVRMEEVLIGRARGAFLVRWFGPRFPMRGGHLRGVLVNLDALRERFLAVQRARAPEAPGLNFQEPLAGLAGIAAGLLLSPTSILLLVAFLLRKLPGWLAALLSTLSGVVVGGVALAVGIVALPLALLGLLGVGVFKPEWLQRYELVYEVLGAAARLTDAFLGFMDVLLGPRAKVRNPILRDLFEVFDGLAKFVPLVLALLSVLVVYLGNNILKLARQAVALLEVKDATLDAVSLVVSNTSETLAGMLSGPRSPWVGLTRTFSAVARMLKTIGGKLSARLGEVSTAFKSFGASAGAKVGGYGARLKGFFADAFETHPTGAVIDAFLRQAAVIGEALAALPPEPPKPPKPKSGGGWPFPKWLLAPPPPMPTFPKLPTPADIARRMGGLPQSLKVEPRYKWQDIVRDTIAGKRPLLHSEGLEELEVARGIHNALARERREQERAAGKALMRARAQETALREVMVGVVETVLPPALHAHVPMLREVFEAIDENLYGGKKYPVRTPPDSGRLRPVVHRLHLRHPDGATAEVKGFKDRLVHLLHEQQYRAPAEA